MLMLLVAVTTWAQAYYPGNRTTTLEAGKKYFISVATYYGSACTNLLYNNGGTLAKSDLPATASTDNAAYLFTVEETGDGYLAYIKNSDGKYIQADDLASTETKTGVYVIPYFEGKAVCCGSDVDACDELGNRIAYASITAETPIVTVQKNADYTNSNNRNGWRYISGLSAGVNWCTAFAFYEAVELTDAELAEKQGALNETIASAQALLTTAGFASTGGEIALQVTDPAAAGYISCSNIDPQEGSNMAWLIDGKNDTFIHTNWHSVSASNDYLTVYLGEGKGVEEFYLSEVTRAGVINDFPKSVQILGSTDGSEYTEVAVIDGLPQSAGQSYKSSLIDCDPTYEYLRFVVTTGDNRIYFHMAEFGLSTPLKTTVNAEYENKAKILYGLSLAVAEAQAVVEGTDLAVIAEAKANIELYMSELNKVYPFTVTTDDENPVLYAINSGRGDAYWYPYDSTDGKIALSQYTGADTQFWFFKEVETDDYKCALQLYPYTDKTKAMSYENTNSAAAKIVAQTPGTEGWTNLWLLATTNDAAPYGLQTYNKANYLSNNGGTANKMGMYTAAPSADPGTAMYFYTPAGALQDLIDEAKEKATNTGTKIGNYKDVTALNAAIAAAEENLENGNYSVVELNAAIAALEIYLPEEGKFYTITTQGADRTGKTALTVEANGGLKGVASVAMDGVFQFIEAGDNAFYLYSVERGTYLSTATLHGYNAQNYALATETSAAKSVTLSHLANGIVGITPNGGAMLHVAGGSPVVGWNETAATNASAWVIEEVEDITALSHDVTIGDAGYATLYLNYAVTVPTGVKAFPVTVDGEWAVFGEALTTIPANTGVIIAGETGEAATAGTYKFNYAAPVAAIEGNKLAGSTIDTFVEGSAYVLGYINVAEEGEDERKEVGFYTATLNLDADGKTGATHFKNNANKAYLAVPVVEGVASYSFRFGEGTTGISEVTTENGNVKVIYDLTGRRVETITAPGIYVVNGKKVLVK